MEKTRAKATIFLLDAWMRIWERVNDLMNVSRVDSPVLFSSFVMGCIYLTLLYDPLYLERYPALTQMARFPGGRELWLWSTGLVSSAQFVSAFSYGLRGADKRKWELWCIVTTALSGSLYLAMHSLLSWEREGILSRMCLGLFSVNALFAVRFGFNKALQKSRDELLPLIQSMARDRRIRISLSGRARIH